ncbi:hypothetical protein ABW19_dt0210016 [Dactylella cylindrospora]|nr:hypothetical protein ABW19_dt0210016 [Dactylella cylindrospora]
MWLTLVTGHVEAFDALSPFPVTPAPPEPSVFRRAANSTTVSVTTYTENKDGYLAGDIIISLPSAVAKKANEIIQKDPNFIADCSDGLEDSSVKPKAGAKKRAVQYADAICGCENLIENAFRFGPLAALRDVDMGEVVLRAAEAAEALAVVLRHAKSVSAQLALDPLDIATLAWVLAWEHYQKKKNIQTVNVISATEVVPQTKQCTTIASKCTADCKVFGAIMLNCNTVCQERTTTGICSASGVSTTVEVSTTTITPWTVFAPPPPLPAPTAECPGKSSGFPSTEMLKVVNSDFCRLANRNPKDVTRSYDGTGDDFLTTLGPAGEPNDLNLKLFRIDLTWKPFHNANPTCSKNCVDAYTLLKDSNCGKNGGIFMSRTGQVNVGCGIYSYSIIPPPAVSPRACYDKFPHDATRRFDLELVLITLSNWKGLKLNPGDQKLYQQSKKISGTIYEFIVSWIANCVSTVVPMSVGDPAPGHKFHDLMFDNWKKCYNKGTGGYIDAGCLRYEFMLGYI